jgi:ureidoacrylate peracid hydrolase
MVDLLGAREKIPSAAGTCNLSWEQIPQVQRLLDAFRCVGRPVIHIITTHDSAYADAQWPHWRSGLTGENRTFLIEGSWGAQIADELKPQDREHIVVKKGYGGFSNTPLDTILRHLGITTCVVAGGQPPSVFQRRCAEVSSITII